MNIREKLLSSQVKRFEILEYPELGIKVKVRGMSYEKRTAFIRDNMLDPDRLDMVNAVPKAIIECFADPQTDQPIFTVADFDAIKSLSPETIESAREVIWRVIGLALPVMEKNSEGTEASGPSTV